MTSVMPWRRLWRDVNSDPRLTTLPPEARLVFISLIPELEDDGTLPVIPGLTLEAHLSELLRLPVHTINQFLPLLAHRGLLLLDRGTLRMPAFEARQGGRGADPTTDTPKPRGSSAERMARLRAKRREASVTGDVTSDKSGDVTQASQVTRHSDGDKIREDKTRRDEETVTSQVTSERHASQPPVTNNQPSLRETLEAVERWSEGRLSQIVSTSDGLDLKKVFERLAREYRVDAHDWEVLGYWCRTGNPGFATLKRSLTWNWLLGDDRQGARIAEAIGEARRWERDEDKKEARRAHA